MISEGPAVQSTKPPANVFITRFCAWAPGIAAFDEWNEWALGKREISRSAKGPELLFAEPMFRRRLSQISKMTIQVVRDVLLEEERCVSGGQHEGMPSGLAPAARLTAEEAKIIFVSFRGELSKQFQINKMLIEEKTLSPAAFSLSVFNAPAALAAMALGLKGGYCALFPGEERFSSALDAAKASLLCGAAQKLIFVYADEEAPPQYERFFEEIPYALSFCLLLSKAPGSIGFPLPAADDQSPLDFLKKLILQRAADVSP